MGPYHAAEGFEGRLPPIASCDQPLVQNIRSSSIRLFSGIPLLPPASQISNRESPHASTCHPIQSMQRSILAISSAQVASSRDAFKTFRVMPNMPVTRYVVGCSQHFGIVGNGQVAVAIEQGDNTAIQVPQIASFHFSVTDWMLLPGHFPDK
jgi:hypothetical protein